MWVSTGHKQPNTVRVEFQGGLVATAYSRPREFSRKTKSLRGEVAVFSRRSRSRLLKLFARMDYKQHKWIFITLTYGKIYPDERGAKKHLRAFIKRLSRYVDIGGKKYAWIWRLDYQDRGAPHFHLMVADLPFIGKEFLQMIWGEIIGQQRPFTRIELIDSRKKAFYYVSKYVAKHEKEARRYVPCGFNSMPYQAARTDGEAEPVSAGRFWGIENKEFLPFAPKVEFVMVDDLAAFYDLKRCARRKFCRIRKARHAGFVLFVDDAMKWLAELERLSAQRYEMEVNYDVSMRLFAASLQTERAGK